MHRLSCGLRHHQRVEYLDGPHDGYGRSKKVYVLDGNVPILVRRTTMEETLDVEAKNHVEMFHHYFFTLAPDDKYIRYTMEKAMYLVDETGLAQYNTLKEKGFYSNILGTSAVFRFLRQYHLQQGEDGVHLLRAAAYRTAQQYPNARTGYGGTAQACTPDGEQPARAAHRELAHAAEQGHRAKDKSNY